MLILIIILLILLALLPVLIPFFRSSEGSSPMFEPAELQELLDEKQMIYAAIKELEFDHQAGKLSVTDYEEARHSYELRAIALLQEIDRLGGQPAIRNGETRGKRRR
jgi:flagellar basal body-associated protein FliL